MATYNKKDMSKTKPDIFKSRTKEWDANEWQGRSKRQVESNEKLSAITIMALGVFVIAYAIYALITTLP